MKMKKVIAVILTVIMVLGLTACGKAQQTEKKETLILGTSADYPPFEFITVDKNGKQQFEGIDISLAEKLAEDQGLKLEVVNMSFENLMVSLQKGEIDMVLAAISENEERAKVADFSDSYYKDYPPMILVKADKVGEYKTLESFSGKTVGAQTGTTKVDLVKNDMKGATLLPLASVTDLINNLVYDKCDAIVLDGAVALQYAEENKDLAVADVEIGTISPYAIAVQKGDPSNLLDSFNKTIANVLKDGSMDKWIEEANEVSKNAIE